MSPVLFNLITDKVINSVKEVVAGYRMGQKSIKILCYGDDAVLMANNEDDLQLLYRFQAKTWYGLRGPDDDFGGTTSTELRNDDGRNGQRMKNRILADLPADLSKDGARDGYLLHTSLNNIKRSRRS
ncbi:hypothetical protein Trydic_g16763 [Trypoxylus dichotomus]